MKTKYKIFFIFIYVLASFPAQGAVFHPESYRLSNGMQIVVVTNTLSDAVAHMVWYKVGARDDPYGKSGLAHYLEHMMFKETEKLESGAYSSQISALGGQLNAFTGQDSTAYHVQISAEHLGLIMQMEAERMHNLIINDDDAKTERDVVLSEREERTENNPIGIFYEKFNTAFFRNDPYSRPIIGWRQEISSLNPADIKNFYRQYYRPNNAILVISGNVTAQEVLRLAAGTFGKLKPQTHIAFPNVIGTQSHGISSNVIMRDPRVKQPFWIQQISAPNYRENPQRALALEVLTEILASGEVGLLYRHFVMEKESASSIDVNYDSMRRGPAAFSLIASPNSKADIFVLAKQIEAYMKKLANKKISASSVREAKKRLLDAAIFARDRLMAPAQILGSTLASGYKIDTVEEWPARIEKVTQAQVNAALVSLVEEKHIINGMLLPEKEKVAP